MLLALLGGEEGIQKCLRIGKIRSLDRVGRNEGLAPFRGAGKPKILERVELALHPYGGMHHCQAPPASAPQGCTPLLWVA